MSRGIVVAGATALGCVIGLVGVATGASAASTATATGPGRLPAAGQLKQLSGQPQLKPLARSAAALSTATITKWSKTVTDGASSFTYTMVGKDPTVLQAAPNTKIKTELVPVIIKFSNGDTWDPTLGDSCDTTSALTRVTNSPIFKSKAYSLGGTAVGTGQYVDIFQRANYWQYTKPTGINPGYNVKLGLTVHAAVTINVPNAQAAEGTTVCGSGKLGAVEINWLDSYLQNQMLPSLAGQGIGVKFFPIFLLGNVVEYITTTGNCCVLGYHSALQVTAGIQTYGVSMYDNTGDFAGSGDVSVLSHEVAEWMDDPFGNNPTKPWGHIGQVSGCQANLEVGDPLSGTVVTVVTGGHTFHVQELAFTSWFYHQSPSTGVNGWYSDFGKFTTAALPCP